MKTSAMHLGQHLPCMDENIVWRFELKLVREMRQIHGTYFIKQSMFVLMNDAWFVGATNIWLLKQDLLCLGSESCGAGQNPPSP